MFRLITFVSTLSTAAVGIAAPENPVEHNRLIHLRPTQCVALHKGQTCFQKIQLTLHNKQQQRLCVFRSEAKEPLLCAEPAELKQLSITFEGKESLPFYVIEQAQQTIVASTLFEVSWVYRSSRKNSTDWRLF